MAQKKKKVTIKWTGQHHKKIIDNLDDLFMKGKYMSVKLNSLLLEVSLSSEFEEDTKSFSLIETIYHNLWDYRLRAFADSSCVMIDSEGFQHKGDGCEYIDYTRIVSNNSNDYREVNFPWPQLILESNAKTKGWVWFNALPKGVLPERFIFKFEVFEPGATSGWVQDEETFEFIFASEDLLRLFASTSKK